MGKVTGDFEVMGEVMGKVMGDFEVRGKVMGEFIGKVMGEISQEISNPVEIIQKNL